MNKLLTLLLFAVLLGLLRLSVSTPPAGPEAPATFASSRRAASQPAALAGAQDMDILGAPYAQPPTGWPRAAAESTATSYLNASYLSRLAPDQATPLLPFAAQGPASSRRAQPGQGL